MNDTPSQTDVNQSPTAGAQEITATISQQKLKVAWITGTETLRNLGRALNPLAVGLMDELIEVVAAIPATADAEELPSPPVELLRYGRLRFGPLETKAFAGLVDDLKSRQVQLLHALDFDAARLTRRIARRTNLRYVLSCHSISDVRRVGRIGSQTGGVTASSEPVFQALTKLCGAARERLHLLRPGVHQVPQPTCFMDASRNVGIVTAGSMDKPAAMLAVVRSFGQIVKHRDDCVFVVIGSGPAEAVLRKEAEKLGLRRDVTFVPRQSSSQMAGILKAADVFISPAMESRTNMPVLLAMAAGVPVLVADGGSGEIAIDGKTAVCFRQGDQEGLTIALSGLLDNRGAASRLAEDALEHIRERHAPANMVALLAGIYRGAVTRCE